MAAMLFLPRPTRAQPFHISSCFLLSKVSIKRSIQPSFFKEKKKNICIHSFISCLKGTRSPAQSSKVNGCPGGAAANVGFFHIGNMQLVQLSASETVFDAGYCPTRLLNAIADRLTVTKFERISPRYDSMQIFWFPRGGICNLFLTSQILGIALFHQPGDPLVKVQGVAALCPRPVPAFPACGRPVVFARNSSPN